MKERKLNLKEAMKKSATDIFYIISRVIIICLLVIIPLYVIDYSIIFGIILGIISVWIGNTLMHWNFSKVEE